MAEIDLLGVENQCCGLLNMKILGYVNIFLEQCQIPKSDQMILLWRKYKIYLFSFPFSVCMSTQPTPIFPKMYRDWKGFQGYDDTRVHFYGGIEGPLSSKKNIQQHQQQWLKIVFSFLLFFLYVLPCKFSRGESSLYFYLEFRSLNLKFICFLSRRICYRNWTVSYSSISCSIFNIEYSISILL